MRSVDNLITPYKESKTPSLFEYNHIQPDIEYTVYSEYGNSYINDVSSSIYVSHPSHLNSSTFNYTSGKCICNLLIIEATF